MRAVGFPCRAAEARDPFVSSASFQNPHFVDAWGDSSIPGQGAFQREEHAMKDIKQGLAVRTAFSISCSWLALGLLQAFAPGARAGDPTSNAFRKLANSAGKEVRTAVNAQVVVVKAALAGYVSGDTELPEAMHAAVAAVSSSVSRDWTALLDEGTGLATAGADLLSGFLGQVGEDFLDGGGGAWDRFKGRAEGLAHKADHKLEREFGKFLKGLAKQAKKQGFDPDTRWRLCGHNPLLLQGVPGPVLATPSTSPCPPAALTRWWPRA
jgi:hypothetical protein